MKKIKDVADNMGDKLDNDGIAEKAGEKIDKAVEKVKKATKPE